MRSDAAAEREGYFETLYAANADPWQYDTCAYEFAKRAHTLSLLRPHYARGCEIGCSNGVLTAELAARCDRIVAIDISPAAAELARQRLAAVANAEVRVMHLPHDDLDGTFDLLMLSEVLYFLDADEVTAMAALAARHVAPGGDVLIVSYDGETQTRLSGRETTERFVTAAAPHFTLIHAEQRPEYHVRLLRRHHDAT